MKNRLKLLILHLFQLIFLCFEHSLLLLVFLLLTLLFLEFLLLFKQLLMFSAFCSFLLCLLLFTSCFALFFCFLCVLHLHHINCMLFQSFLREFPLCQEIHSLIRISFFRFIHFLLVSLFFVTRNVCFIHSIYISHMESFENLYSGLRFSYLGLILPVHWYHLFVPIRYHEIFRFSRRNIV